MALEFAVLVFLGIFIVRIRLVGPDFRSQLAKYVTNVALPCMIARSLYAQTERFHGVGLVLLLAVLAVRVALTYLFRFGFKLGFASLYIPNPIGWVVGLILSFYRFRSGKWESKSVVKR